MKNLYSVECQLKVFIGFDTTDYGYHGVGRPSSVINKYQYFVLAVSKKQAKKIVKDYLLKQCTEQVFAEELFYDLSKNDPKKIKKLWEKKWKESDSEIKAKSLSFLS